jgi:hypothetical protein
MEETTRTYINLVVKPEGRKLLEYLGVNMKKMSKYILKLHEVLIYLVGRRQGPLAEYCESFNEIFGLK